MHIKPYFLLIILAFFCSCKKHINDDVVSGKYQSGNIIIEGLKMYTLSGQIHDQEIIKNYLTRRNISHYFSFDLTTQKNEESLTITFEQNKKATIKILNPIKSIETEVLEIYGSEIILASIDSSEWYINSSSNNRCDKLINSILLPNPLIHVIHYAVWMNIVSPGNSIILKFINGKLRIPIISWIASSNKSGISCSSSVKDDWNVFNPNIGNQLTSGDTIVVKTKLVVLEKR